MTVLRGIATVASAVVVIAWSAPAFAHAHLESSTIADGAEIAAPPEQMALTFDEPVALAGASLTGADGAEIALEFTPVREPAATHAVDMPPLEPGGYAFTWRALGDDGHVMTETIGFIVTGAADAGGADMHSADDAADADDAAGHMHSDDEHGHDGAH